MTLSIAHVPEDILLEFAKELDVADLFSFLSVRFGRGQQFRGLILCFHSSAAPSASSDSEGPFGWMLLSGYVRSRCNPSLC